ncbi:RNA methyltransferase [Flavobacterium sp.]|jgi:TrmH family RNA methyltransferase|uniref:RNA methyltransferase n=1 Tax=Flavobacterium sp. TaxID=239 RepID=UPI0037BEA671
MVSKNQIKLITGLVQKKNRTEQQLFIAEGIKVIQELFQSDFELVHLYTVANLNIQVPSDKITQITNNELKRISALTTPNECLALFKIPISSKINDHELIVALDDIRDPGNLGTIIRLCDWFGVKQLICSETTVDVFNPKVVQATMGSLARVRIVYADLVDVLKKTKLPIYGTFMDGNNIYTEQKTREGIIVMGNESNGISKNIEQLIQRKITIPRFGTQQKTESLNVATATAITLSEFCRNS